LGLSAGLDFAHFSVDLNHGGTKVKLVPAIILIMIFSTVDVASAASLSINDMINFTTQSLCLDAVGKPSSQIPIIDNCASMRPQRAADIAVYQKHDWPDQRVFPHYYLTGHQASDSVLISSGSTPVIEQTLDFGGDPQHQFERFGANDGGQIVVIVGGWASAVMTEGANGEVQWLIGNGCKRSIEGGKLSWLMFNQDTPTGKWADIVAQLGFGRSASDCPQRFNQAYTRYRREQVVFPFRLVSGNTVTTTNRSLDVIVSEHFGAGSANPASDPHLERFFFARNLGWLRWERWQNVNFRSPDVPPATAIRDAQTLAVAGRCPTVAYSTSPGPGWYQIDCRTWTTITKVTGPWSVSDYRWPAVGGTDWGRE
jgi:hypothetical protein